MRQIGKATWQGLMVILTAMSLAACNVGEPEAGKAKGTSPASEVRTSGIVFEGQPDRGDSPKQFFIIEATFKASWDASFSLSEVSIQAIDLISDRAEKIDTWKFKPSTHANCIDHYS